MATERRAWSWRQQLLKSGLPSTTRHVLLTLSCHVNDAGEPCYPTVEKLALETGLSKRVVMLHLENGKEQGWIKIERHGFSGQKWATNQYELSWPETQKGGDAKSPPFDEGGDFNDTKVVTQSNHLQGSPYIRVFPLLSQTPLSPVGDDGGFERWWQAYPKPRRIAKSKCLRIWRRKGLEAKAAEVLLVLASDVRSSQWQRDDFQYVPLPATWLSQDRFERDVGALQPAKRVCTVCGEDAGFKVGWRDLCQAHFRERE